MWFRIKDFFQFLSNSKNQYGIHSPFVYQFLIKCLYSYKRLPQYKSIKTFRNSIKLDSKVSLALNLRKSKLLNRIVTYFEPNNIIVIGDKLGLISGLMSFENNAEIYCITPNGTFVNSKKEVLRKNDLKTISVVSDSLNVFLKSYSQQIDMAFIKTESAEELLHNFDDLYQHTHEKSFFIIDGIHKSRQMKETWEAIKDRPEIKITIDLYFWGIVFCKTTQRQQHFKIRSWF